MITRVVLGWTRSWTPSHVVELEGETGMSYYWLGMGGYAHCVAEPAQPMEIAAAKIAVEISREYPPAEGYSYDHLGIIGTAVWRSLMWEMGDGHGVPWKTVPTESAMKVAREAGITAAKNSSCRLQVV